MLLRNGNLKFRKDRRCLQAFLAAVLFGSANQFSIRSRKGLTADDSGIEIIADIADVADHAALVNRMMHDAVPVQPYYDRLAKLK